MIISGNQTAVKELMNLLDPSFKPPFLCKCYMINGSKAHYCECSEQSFAFETEYGCIFHQYELEYDGEKIVNCRELIGPTNGSCNLLTGCVR